MLFEIVKKNRPIEKKLQKYEVRCQNERESNAKLLLSYLNLDISYGAEI